MGKACGECKALIREWNQTCRECGYQLVLEPKEETRSRYLRRPSLGALLWTQGWTVGARLYLLFLLSLIPVVGLVVLVIGVLFGRRLSWKYGGWENWEVFTERMKTMDVLGIIWAAGLILAYLFLRFN